MLTCVQVHLCYFFHVPAESDTVLSVAPIRLSTLTGTLHVQLCSLYCYHPSPSICFPPGESPCSTHFPSLLAWVRTGHVHLYAKPLLSYAILTSTISFSYEYVPTGIV